MGRLTNTLLVLSTLAVKRFAELGVEASIFGGYSHPFQGYVKERERRATIVTQKRQTKERQEKIDKQHKASHIKYLHKRK